MKTTVDTDEAVVDTLREKLGTRTKGETIDSTLRFLLDRVQHGGGVVSTVSGEGRIVCLPDEEAGALQRAMELPQANGDHSARLV